MIVIYPFKSGFSWMTFIKPELLACLRIFEVPLAFSRSLWSGCLNPTIFKQIVWVSG